MAARSPAPAETRKKTTPRREKGAVWVAGLPLGARPLRGPVRRRRPRQRGNGARPDGAAAAHATGVSNPAGALLSGHRELPGLQGVATMPDLSRARQRM